MVETVGWARLRDVWSGEFESREQPKRASFGSEVRFVSCGTVIGWLVYWSTVDVRKRLKYTAREIIVLIVMADADCLPF